MIMRPGPQLLLPANPWFVWGSLALAMLWNMLPLGHSTWMPDLLAVVLVFWSVHQPRRVGIATAFVLGLAMDVHQTALLGQHALAYTVLSFLALTVHRRLLWFSLSSQALQVLPLFAAAHVIELAVRLLSGAAFPGLGLILAPPLESLLWPVAHLLLLAPQRRPVDPDKNRPL